MDVWFSEAIDASTFDTGDIVVVTPDDQTVTASRVQEVGLNRFRVEFPGQTTEGLYHVQVGPDVADLAGNLLAKR